MYNENASPTVTNCIFTGNTADRHGGGMYNLLGSPMVTNCTFTNNTAIDDKGGGMYNYNSSPTVTDCTFSDNTADSGGGLFIELGSPTVTNCTFTNNTAMDHAGMGIFQSSPTVTNCTFSGNTVERAGGGLSNVQSSSTVTNCTFTGNTTNYFGGGMWNDGCSPTITNCTFTDNTSSIDGGGMCNRNSSPMVTNCTFSGNIAIEGGGMYSYNDSSPMVTNCILWGDSPDEIFNDEFSSTTVTYSDVQGGWPGTGNIDADPLFADADLRLSDASPCINAGSNAALPPDTADLDGDGDTTEPIPLDLDGNARILNGVVDMGAFETYIIIEFSGWVWIQSGGDFGYSLDEDDLLYFLSFGPVWYYNTATSQWSEEGPVGWTYVNWPFLYESATSTTMFALPPESGLWVYHFRPSQWTVSPRIIP